MPQIHRQRVLSGFAEQHDALLRAFAGNAHFPRGQVKVGYAQIARFADAQPTAVYHLKQRLVAQTDGLGGVRGVHKARRLVLRQKTRQSFLHAHNAALGQWIALDNALARKPLQECAQGAELARHAGPRIAEPVEPRKVCAQVMAVERAHIGNPVLRHVLIQRLYIGGVVANGQIRKPLFGSEMFRKAV